MGDGWIQTTIAVERTSLQPVIFCPQSTRDGEAETFLQYLCSNDVALPVGGTVRTLVLNKQGGIELSSTVIRNAQNK